MDPILLQEYYQQRCNRNNIRLPNRASCHFITNQNIESEDQFNPLIRNKLVRYLRSKVDIQVGDIIMISSMVGYKNRGFYIFNGNSIDDLSYDINDSGHIPEEFQVIINFPPKYWSQIIDYNELVPFNFNRWLPNINIDNVRLLKVHPVMRSTIGAPGNSQASNNQYDVLSISFQNNEGTVFTVIDNIMYDLTNITMPQLYDLSSSFVEQVKSLTYFNYFNPDNYVFSLPSNINIENVIVVPPI